VRVDQLIRLLEHMDPDATVAFNGQIVEFSVDQYNLTRSFRSSETKVNHTPKTTRVVTFNTYSNEAVDFAAIKRQPGASEGLLH